MKEPIIDQLLRRCRIIKESISNQKKEIRQWNSAQTRTLADCPNKGRHSTAEPILFP